MSALEEIRPGLHRWLAEHPNWTPDEGGADGWEPDVWSLVWTGGDAVVLVDPLLPAGHPVWAELDALVAAHGGPVAVAITCHWHGRNGADVVARYVNSSDVSVHAHVASERELAYEVTEPFEGDIELPGGVFAYAVHPAHAEVVLWIEAAGALIAGDVLLGADGDRGMPLRICPADWLSPTPVDDVRAALRPLLELPVEIVVPLHGAAVVRDARETLEHAVG